MHEPAVGEVFAGHRIDGVAGRGGMGVVYRATQLALGRTVALKVVAPERGDDPAIRERFLRESRLAAATEHPNVIPVHQVGEEDGIAYIVMRYVAGDDLRTLVRREGPLPPRRAATIVAQVAAALDAAHASGLVHRDVKPANVLLTQGDHAYLTDFGLTKDLRSAGVTGPGRWVGTLDYVAPEQVRGEAVDARTDVYALGATLFFALTGRVPFAYEAHEAKLWAQLSEPPPAPSATGAAAAFDPVIARAMAKAAAERYPSAGDLGRAALAAAADRPVAEPERSVGTGAAAPDAASEQTTAAGQSAAGQSPGRLRRAWPAALLAAAAAGAAAFVLAADGEDPAAPAAGAAPRIAVDVPAGRRPNSLLAAGQRLWVGSFRSSTLAAFDRRTGERLPEAPAVGTGARALARAGAHVWVSLADKHRIVRAHARGEPSPRVTIDVPGRPGPLAVDGGNLWVVLRREGGGPDASLARIDLRTRAVRTITDFPAGLDGLVMAGRRLWAISAASPMLLQIDRASGEPGRRVRLPGSDPSALAYGAGSLWVTIYDDDSLVRVDPATGETATIVVGSRPTGVAVHGDAAWVTNFGSSTVTLVDTRSGRVAGEPLDVPLNPYAVLADGGGAWVTCIGTGRLVRVTGRAG